MFELLLFASSLSLISIVFICQESDESDASVTVIEEPQFNVDDEEEDDQENFPSLRKKGRKPKEAGLQKLDAFVTKVDRKQFKSDLAKRRAAGEEECKKNVVDSIDFINNFNVNQSSDIILVRAWL
jgi:hypothetical protein